MLELVREVKNFSDELTGSRVRADDLYRTNDFGSFRLLIPDEMNDLGRINYCRVVFLKIDELPPNLSLSEIRRMALERTPKPPEERGFNIARNVFVIIAKKIKGRYTSRRTERELFLFFHEGKFGEEWCVKTACKILGSWYLYRAGKFTEFIKGYR